MEKHSLIVKKWRLDNPLKAKAHAIVACQVRQGKLIKLPCYVCNNPKVEAHHKDYHEPLNIVWLCRQCHGIEHRKEGRKEPSNKLVLKDGRKRNIKSKFITHDAIAIELREKGYSYGKIAKEMGISRAHAFKIVNNKIYN